MSLELSESREHVEEQLKRENEQEVESEQEDEDASDEK